MPEENWLEKVIGEYKKQNPSLGEEEINGVRELVSSADMQGKELRQSELTRHAQTLLKSFLKNNETDAETKHES